MTRSTDSQPSASSPVTQEATYRISAGRKSITCLKCGRESFHPEDVRHRFCGCCNVFHQPVEPGSDVSATSLTKV